MSMMNSGMDMMEPTMDKMEGMGQPMKMTMEPMPMEPMPMEPMAMEPMANHRTGPSVAPHLFHGGFHHHPSRRVLAAPVLHPHHHAQAVLPNAHLHHGLGVQASQHAPLLVHSAHQTTHLPILHQVAPRLNCSLERMMEVTEV